MVEDKNMGFVPPPIPILVLAGVSHTVGPHSRAVFVRGWG
jgi:hypothetical protein